jgi:hypothetical protein
MILLPLLLQAFTCTRMHEAHDRAVFSRVAMRISTLMRILSGVDSRLMLPPAAKAPRQGVVRSLPRLLSRFVLRALVNGAGVSYEILDWACARRESGSEEKAIRKQGEVARGKCEQRLWRSE